MGGGIFQQAQEAGMKCAYVSNGNATPEVLRLPAPVPGGVQDRPEDDARPPLPPAWAACWRNVLDSIRRRTSWGLWVEMVTLVVPGFNDSTEELMEAARFIASVSPDIPWHVTAFHPDYKMTDPPPTSVSTLLRAAEIGEEAGLSYVYAGNIPGQAGGVREHLLPALPRPAGGAHRLQHPRYRITPQGACPQCSRHIAGVWSEQPSGYAQADRACPPDLR